VHLWYYGGAMNNKKNHKEYVAPPPYAVNPDIYVLYELQFGNDLIKPGTKIKFKNDRTIYLFRLLAHNKKLDQSWIDVMEEGGGWRSFRVENLKSVVKPKRSRRHKPVI
jgi:hypothetical protein